MIFAYPRYYICMRYYFDYAAATPVDPQVEKSMKPYWGKVFGNPGALHWFGQEASAAVFKSRDTIAQSLGCSYREIIFTGSATEANNLVLRGVVKTAREKTKIQNPKIIISAIEHDSILDTARDLVKEGVEIAYLPVQKNGVADLNKLKSLLNERTILVSIMYANNEIGTIQPISEIAKIIKDFKVRHHSKNLGLNSLYPLLHTDAAQAFNYADCNVDDLGVDAMTLSSQKIYGPKGVGALYVRQKLGSVKIPISISPIITGGKSQEYGLRSGTENVPGIVGFAKAIEIANALRAKESLRLKKLQDYFISQAKKKIPNLEINGDLQSRLPNNINMYISGTEGQDLIIKLDLEGFAVSPGAACSARTCSPSHVLKALSYSDERATNSVRITFGRHTKKRDIDMLLKHVIRFSM